MIKIYELWGVDISLENLDNRLYAPYKVCCSGFHIVSSGDGIRQVHLVELWPNEDDPGPRL